VREDTDLALVSVLVAAYNHERFVAESIESVCAQTHRPLELIVVDDGSSDATAAVIAALADDTRRQLERFVFVRQRHHGTPAALNRALRQARGEFVATLPSDDVYLPDKIDRLLALPDWADRRTAAVFGDAYYIDAHGARVGLLEDHSIADPAARTAETRVVAHLMRWRFPPEPGPLGSYASILRGSHIPMVSTLIRRGPLQAIGGFDESLFIEDYGLWLRLARDHRIAATPDVVAAKRRHDGNASLVHKRSVFRDVLELMVREKRHARSDPVARRERAAARDRSFQAVRVYGTTSDLVRVLARHPVAGPPDLLAAWRAVATTS
jgi:GT2 family glycosyltransferase